MIIYFQEIENDKNAGWCRQLCLRWFNWPWNTEQ